MIEALSPILLWVGVAIWMAAAPVPLWMGSDSDDSRPNSSPVRIARPEFVKTEVHFTHNSAAMAPQAFPMADAMVAVINQGRLSVEVQGHADANERRPAELGVARAEAVKAVLVSRGVPPEQLVVRSYGADRSVCPEKTKACRSRNRRVEFLIIRNQ